MNPLAVFVVACLAFASAQQTGSGLTAPSSSPNTGLTPTGAPTSGHLGPGGLGAGPLGSAPTLPNNPNSGAGSNVLMNPLLWAAGGSDSMLRALMLPHLGNLGGVNQYYFLRGGMDKMAQSMMSDVMSRMLAQSMPGMSPMMAPLLTSQMIDSPDGWTMSNLLFNGFGRQGQTPTRPTPAPASGAGGLFGVFGNLFGGQPQQQQQTTGQGMQLPLGAASPSAMNANSNNPLGNMALPIMFSLF